MSLKTFLPSPLARQLLLPLLGCFLVLSSITIGLMALDLDKRLAYVATQRAYEIAQALSRQAVQYKADPAALDPIFVNVLNNPFIRHVTLVRGNGLQVLASSHQEWRGQPLQKVVPAQLLNLIITASQSEKIGFINSSLKRQHILAYPFKLKDGTPVALLMENDTSLMVRVIANQFILFIVTLVCVLLLLMGFGWYILQRRVVKPLIHISSVITSRQNGDSAIRTDTLGKKNEIALIAGQLNRLMDYENNAQSSLRDAATEMELQNGALAEARDAAQNATRLKSDFLAAMSHEIRTPMNGILGMAELLMQSPLSQKQEHFARTLLISAESLLNLINDILDLSKIEAGKLAITPVPFTLTELIESTVEILAHRAREKGLELAVHCPPGLPTQLVADPLRIRQVLTNLIGNAIKFTEKGYILLEVDMIAGTAPKLRFQVHDTGIGIAPENLARIFEKFTQADASTTRKYGGTGLGLAICGQLASMMEADIKVESEPGQGSTFSFSIPLQVAETSPASSSLTPRILQSLQNKRILVVDDLPVNLTILAEQLQQAKAQVTAVGSARAALTALASAHALNQPFDLALVDYLMPEMHGEELARTIRAESRHADTALVLLSSAGARGFEEKLSRIGINGLLEKPLRASLLLETLADIMHAWQSGNRQGFVAQQASTGSLNTKLCRFPGARILMAEDNRVNQEFANEILQSLGVSVHIVSTGAAALRQLDDQRFDLVFLDCEMPELNGYETSQAIRQLKQQGKIPANLPVIALTANAQPEDRDLCLAAGMSDYLAKPLRKENLSRVLAHWLPSTLVQQVQPETPPPPLSNRRLLLVEDNRVNRMLAQEILESFGATVTVAENGLIALQKLKNSPLPELVLMDCQMPELDGYETTRRLRTLQAAGALPNLPVVALTANAFPADRARCLEAGMDDYLAKPFRKEDLLALLLKWLPSNPVQAQESEPLGPSSLIDEEALNEYRTLLGQQFPAALRLYLADAAFALETMQRHLQAGRPPEGIIFEAHRLKSSSGYVGAAGVAALCRKLEQAARHLADLRRPAETLVPLHHELSETLIATQRILIQHLPLSNNLPAFSTSHQP